MRTNEEFTKAVYERRNDFLVKRKKKRKKIAAAVSPLIICIVLFSAFVVQDWGRTSMSLREKATLKSSETSGDLLASQAGNPRAEGSINPAQNDGSSQGIRWEDFSFTEEGQDMYDTIRVGVVNDIEVINDGENKDLEHIEYAIWLTRGKETMAFTMAGDELYYNGEYCRKLDEAEIEYLLGLVD